MKELWQEKKGSDIQGGSHVLTIVGIYETRLFLEVQEENIFGVDVYRSSPYNRLYADFETGKELTGSKEETHYCDIYVDSPEHLQSVIRRLQKIDLDWEKYEISNPTETYYTQYAGQITLLINTTKKMVLLTVAAGSVVFLVVLNAANLGFSKRTGILLSLGEKKKRILLQKLLEYVCIGLLVIPLAVLLGRLIAGALEVPLMPRLVSSNEMYTISAFETGATEFIPLLKVTLKAIDLVCLAAYTLALVLIGFLPDVVRLQRYNIQRLFAAAEQ